MAIEIPLNGGLITQADAEEVGINGATILENVEFDKPGLIYKCTPRKYSGTTVSHIIDRILRWVAPDGKTYWVSISTDGTIYYSETFGGTWTSLLGGFEDSRILNYGSMLRFTSPSSLDTEPHLYQYIDRDYFWGQLVIGTAFNMSPARPVSLTVASHTLGKADMSGFRTTGLTHSTVTYSYKMTAVFDGNQEEALPSGTLGSSSNPVGGTICTDDDSVALQLNIAHSSFTGIQRRITGINIYRQENSGPFYKVCSVSTLLTDTNKISAGSTYIGKTFCDSSSSLTSAINGKALYVNGYKHLINASGYLDAECAVLDTTANWQVWGDNSDKYEDATGGDFEYTGHLNSDAVTDPTTTGAVTGHTDLKFRSLDGDTTDTTNQVGGWFVGDASAKLYDIDGSTFGDWTTAGVITVGQDFGNHKYGDSCLKFYTGNANFNYAYYDLGTGFTGTDTVIVSFWFLMDQADANDNLVKIGIGDLVSAPDKLFVDHDGYYTSGPGDKDKWRYIQSEFLVSDLEGYAESDNLYFTVKIEDPNTSNAMVWIDHLVVTKKVINTTEGKLGMGTRVCSSANLNLGYDDTHAGSLMAVDNQPYDAVRHNLNKTIKTYRPKTQTTGQTLLVGSQYIWLNKTQVSPAGDDNTSYLVYVDDGDTNGPTHPTGETSLEVNFKHSINLEGRQYVADVTLNPLAENEMHNDWVLFSELNQPDVIPISNYISIPDMQGGAIKGLGRLIGDLVVFQEKGIYRLSIPSADPTSWSLSESEPNIGCIATDSIVEYEGGIFFAGKDNFYHLGSNFQAVPITTSIKDEYQSISNLVNTNAIIDIKKNRLLCQFGGSSNSYTYSLDLLKFKQGQEHWSKIKYSTDYPTSFTIDEDLKIYTIDDDNPNTEVSELIPYHSPTWYNYEDISLKRRTGWISTPDMDRSVVLRRLNIRYKTADTLTVKIYIDGDDSTVVKTLTIPADNSGADWYKCKPSVRCRMFMIEIESAASENTVEIRKMEVEFG